jgi:hydrogenase/urease accessory protein HupE
MRRALAVAWMLGFLAAAGLVRAHTPFEASVRVFVSAETTDVAVTCGSELARQILEPAGIAVRELAAESRRTVPLHLAARILEFQQDGVPRAPAAISLATDGLEYRLVLSYPGATHGLMHFIPRFLDGLPPPQNIPFVVTDDVGNILHRAVLSPEQPRAAFQPPPRDAESTPASPLPVATAIATVPAHAAVPATTPAPVAASADPGFLTFFRLGVEHILTGYDHLLFLAALLLGCRRLRPMLIVITLFTLAHSLTLALAALGLAHVSPRIVEPAIAASIVFVCIDNLRGPERAGVRYGLTFAFGLLHGFGFAGALRETGLGGAGANLVVPLAGFNLGVEAGQIAVAAALVALLAVCQRHAGFARLGPRMASAAILLAATGWLVTRTLGFGS